jgi:hypothetical protein
MLYQEGLGQSISLEGGLGPWEFSGMGALHGMGQLRQHVANGSLICIWVLKLMAK